MQMNWFGIYFLIGLAVFLVCAVWIVLGRKWCPKCRAFSMITSGHRDETRGRFLDQYFCRHCGGLKWKKGADVASGETHFLTMRNRPLLMWWAAPTPDTECLFLANNGLSGHVASTSAPPPRADIHWPMSGFVLFSSAYPPTSDIPGEAGNVSS